MSDWKVAHWEGPIWIIFKKSFSSKHIAYVNLEEGRVKWFSSTIYGHETTFGSRDVELDRYWNQLKDIKASTFQWGIYPFFGIMKAIVKFFRDNIYGDTINYADGKVAVVVRDGEGSLEWSILVDADGNYVTHQGDIDDILHTWLIQGALRSRTIFRSSPPSSTTTAATNWRMVAPSTMPANQRWNISSM